jgi:DNA-binding transcriptional ArsR family regulator
LEHSEESRAETTESEIMDDETTAFAATLFAALGSAPRLHIVRALADREMTVGEIAQSVRLSQPNVSQHLAVLIRAGVLTVRSAGAIHCHSLRGPRIAKILALVNEFRQIHAPVLHTNEGE